MALDKSKLLELLNKLPILKEEKQMWYRLGLYIPAQPDGLNRVGDPLTSVYDSLGQKAAVVPNIASNLRLTILEWWQQEKVKPRSQEIGKTIQTTPFDELEMPRG